MKPFHLFQHGGVCFVYHIGAGRFIRISPAAYDCLRRVEDGTPFKDCADAGLRADMEALEADGFFDEVESPMLDDAEYEDAMARHLDGTSNSLELCVSERCNLACRYCYCGTCRDEVRNMGLMDVDTALAAVEQLFRAANPKQGVCITFFGGEPLLNKPVIKAVIARCHELASVRGVEATFSITTNGTLIDEETAELIAGNTFGLMVSLDGPRELHDSQCPTRDGGGSFEQALAGIRTLMRHRRSVTVRCTMAHPSPDPMKLIKFFGETGFTRVVLGPVFNPVYPSPCDFTAEDERTFDERMEREVIPWMLSERKAGRRPIYDPFTDLEEFQAEAEHPAKRSAARCGACHGTMTVGADGTLYPCHRFVGMEKWRIGRLGAPDAERIRRFWFDWRKCMKEKCSQCWAYRFCGGPCPWEVAKADGTFAMDDRRCEALRSWIEQGVWYLDQTGLPGPSGEQEEKGGSKQ